MSLLRQVIGMVQFLTGQYARKRNNYSPGMSRDYTDLIICLLFCTFILPAQNDE